jgi:hypothetical protein
MSVKELAVVLFIGAASVTLHSPTAGFAQQNDKAQEPNGVQATPEVNPQKAIPNAVACFRGGEVLKCTSCPSPLGWHCGGDGDGSCHPPTDTDCQK